MELCVRAPESCVSFIIVSLRIWVFSKVWSVLLPWFYGCEVWQQKMYCDSLSSLIFGCVCVCVFLGRLKPEDKRISLSHTKQFICIIMCICVFKRAEYFGVCGNFSCVFSEVAHIQARRLLADRRCTKLQTLGPLASHWPHIDADPIQFVEINVSINKTDRAKIALCTPSNKKTYQL